jgi:signal transduction histidine kinase
VLRLVAGALLLAVGIGVFVALNERVVVATQVAVAVLVTTAGVGLLAGPWIVRLGRQLTDERTERIRADERAEVAAHLHDSVLQTLAMIQRRASSPAETVALARRQERELRDWLHGGGRPPEATTFAAAIQSLADEVEADHPVAVEVVVVGDAPLTDDLRATVAAAREAAMNAARHSGTDVVSVYAEVEDDVVTTFVRDRGAGFDPAAVPEDRHGLSESIIGRMERHGGRADVQSSPGDGTEITLTTPIARVHAIAPETA